jgi:hypothetical protein
MSSDLKEGPDMQLIKRYFVYVLMALALACMTGTDAQCQVSGLPDITVSDLPDITIIPIFEGHHDHHDWDD